MASEILMSGLSIKKLNGENYSTWQQKVQLLLQKESLWDIVENPPDVLNDEDKVQNCKALAIIELTLEDHLLIHLRGQTSAKQAWEDLRGLFVRVSVGSQIQIARKLFRTRLQTGGSMLQHLEQMKKMLMDLRENYSIYRATRSFHNSLFTRQNI